MALCRQGSEPLQDWSNSSGGPTFRSHDYANNMRQGELGNGFSRGHGKFNRGRKLGRVAKNGQCSVGVFLVLFFGFVGLTLLGSHYGISDKGRQESSESEEFFDIQNSEGQDLAEINQRIRKHGNDENLERGAKRNHDHTLVHGSGSWASKVIGFGQGSTGSGQDSRYWDRDDRRRDEDFDEEDFETSDASAKSAFKQRNVNLGKEKNTITENGLNSHGQGRPKINDHNIDKIAGAGQFKGLDSQKRVTKKARRDLGSGGLYNEQGRNELKLYEAQYEADLKGESGSNETVNENSSQKTDSSIDIKNHVGEKATSTEGKIKKTSQTQDHEQVNVDDEYDDGIDDVDIRAEDKSSDISHKHPRDLSGMQTDHFQSNDGQDLLETESNLDKGNLSEGKMKKISVSGSRSDFHQEVALYKDHAEGYNGKDSANAQNTLATDGKPKERPGSDFDKELSLFIHGFPLDIENVTLRVWSENSTNIHSDNSSWKVDAQKRNTYQSKKKRRKRPSLPCEVEFLNSTVGLVEPGENPKFAKFLLQFVESEEKPEGVDAWEPRFAGHQSLEERENSFYARNQKLHCGFVKGPPGSLSTGFDLSEKDAEFLRTCHIAVSSCIFGKSDNIRIPTSKMISQYSKKNVCFVMFVDEKTLEMLSSEGRQPDGNGHIGLWKIVVVRNLPYTDMRRTGKVPKFLTHRLFPSARYSIWIDSKMRLNSDPLLILEHFLWRGGFEYAISNHYDRHCVWEEVAQNKRLNKYNHTVIDEQFAYYQDDGLTKFNESDPNMILPSYVPEGSFIVRAHTPFSNLFSCLWFNEVDHFTPRDQLSFAYTYLKLRRMNPEKNFRLNMFKDCERRFMAKLFHHRSEETPPSLSKQSKA